MNVQDGEKTITMTEDQLERVIKNAVIDALRESNSKELSSNDAKKKETMTNSFALIIDTALSIILIFSSTTSICSIAISFYMGLNLYLFLFGLVFFVLSILILFSAFLIERTKSIELLNAIFSSIMTLSALLVAIASAVIAFVALYREEIL